MSERAAVANVTAQTAEQGGVLFKLLLFSAALAIAPLSSYFLSLNYVWNGNSTYAAITAIVAANAVLVAYIAVSLQEERKAQAQPVAKAESKKDK
ncbi:VMA21 domain-containing protein [Phanerochaete sordida]|uniref:VMA21 domain-containing protein n=1 Tax=Phanerochaete sordida TaxID=48140 RepID=A0A9P3FXK7_9APHY|nr:VMA21 domain-containing protein [Phanerochaete sordida]